MATWRLFIHSYRTKFLKSKRYYNALKTMAAMVERDLIETSATLPSTQSWIWLDVMQPPSCGRTLSAQKRIVKLPTTLYSKLLKYNEMADTDCDLSHKTEPRKAIFRQLHDNAVLYSFPKRSLNFALSNYNSSSVPGMPPSCSKNRPLF